MRRLIFLFSFICVALGASSQNVTLWYGVNYGKKTSAYDNEWKFVNFGLDYTAPIKNRFDWTVGFGYNTKGDTDRIGYVQSEGNVGYNIVQSDKLGLKVLVGPFAAVKVNYDCGGDFDNGVGSSENKGIPCLSPYSCKTFSCGWQAGAVLRYSRLSLKVGYEHSFTNVYGPYKTMEWFARVGVRL